MLADRLRESIEDWAQELRPRSALLQLAREGGLPPRALALYLESLRYLFSATTHNLEGAVARSNELGLSALAEYFRRKSDEERGHDRWAQDDLAKLPDAAIAGVDPTPSMRALVDLQRKLIERDPLCFVAYGLWAEYFTVLLGDEWLDALAISGYDRSGLSAVAKHVEADRHHAAEGFNELEELAAGRDDPTPLLEAISASAALFESFCDEVYEAARVVA